MASFTTYYLYNNQQSSGSPLSFFFPSFFSCILSNFVRIHDFILFLYSWVMDLQTQLSWNCFPVFYSLPSSGLSWTTRYYVRELEGVKGSSSPILSCWKIGAGHQVLLQFTHSVAHLLAHLSGCGVAAGPRQLHQLLPDLFPQLLQLLGQASFQLLMRGTNLFFWSPHYLNWKLTLVPVHPYGFQFMRAGCSLPLISPTSYPSFLFNCLNF